MMEYHSSSPHAENNIMCIERDTIYNTIKGKNKKKWDRHKINQESQ